MMWRNNYSAFSEKKFEKKFFLTLDFFFFGATALGFPLVLL
jgi:hypothetical protein